MAFNAYEGEDTYTTKYNTNGAAGGGGFVAGDVASSQAGGKGDYGKNTVRPVTIKQILEAQHPHPDANFRVDGEEVTDVTFVGQIRSMSSQPTNVTYKLDDGTGVVEVKQWVDSDSLGGDQMEMDNGKPKLVENSYCRAWGRMKEFNNKRHVGALVIRPITDYNEINYHLLEATAIHLFFTQGSPAGTTKNGVKGAGSDNPGGRGGPQELDAFGKPMAQVSPQARKMFIALQKAPHGQEGLHVQMLASMVGMGVSDAAKVCEELNGVGLIFPTVDDNTWAVMGA